MPRSRKRSQLNETERAEAALDFAARMLAVTQSALQAQGVAIGTIVVFLATQAKLAGMDADAEDFGTVCNKAFSYAVEFEQAAIDGGVISAR